jgi:cytochrome c553
MIDCTPLRRSRALAFAIAAAFWATGPFGVAAQSLQERLQVCGSCHGEQGNSPMEKTPSLAGQPELFLTNQLILMRDRIRLSEVMAPFVKGLTDTQIVELAAHYAKLPPEKSAEPVDQGLVPRGEALAKALRCGICHLPNYAGGEQIPRLTQQRIDYVIESLFAYRDGRRYGIDTSMNGVMVGVSDPDIRALAHYLATVP